MIRFSNNLSFNNFKKKKFLSLEKKLNFIINKKNEILKSLTPDYKYSFLKNDLLKLNKKKYTIRIIGIGGSILGANAIYDFLGHKVKKNVLFFDNLNKKINYKKNEKKIMNLVVSKSGNTLETIANVNILVKKQHKNVFIVGNGKNTLREIALDLKSEVIDHNNFIGGRYSVLSEVGMVPAILMGLNEKKFKQLNNLIKKKTFFKFFNK